MRFDYWQVSLYINFIHSGITVSLSVPIFSAKSWSQTSWTCLILQLPLYFKRLEQIVPNLRRCSLAESRNATHQRRVFLPAALATTVKQAFGTLRGLAADGPVSTHHIAYCSQMCSLYAHVNSPASCILVTWHRRINTVLYQFVVAPRKVSDVHNVIHCFPSRI